MQYVSCCGHFAVEHNVLVHTVKIDSSEIVIYSGGGGTGNLIEDHAWSSQTSVPTTRMPNDVTL